MGIGAAAYGFGAGVFFIAYAIFELPSNVMMEKFGARIDDATWLNADERAALSAAIAAEDAQKAADSGVAHKGSRWKMLADRQLIVFCGIYFCISMGIYANTFWLPAIVRRIPGTNDITVGLLSSLPWICAVIAMYATSKIGDRTGNRRPLLIGSLLVAAGATFVAAVVSPWLALVFLCLAAMGFKSSSPLMWSFPQSTLHPRCSPPPSRSSTRSATSAASWRPSVSA